MIVPAWRRKAPAASGNTPGEGLTERRRSTPAPGGDQLGAALAVDRDEADEAGRRDLLGVFAEAADVAAVAQGDGGEGPALAFSIASCAACQAMRWPRPLWASSHGVRGAFAYNFQLRAEDDVALAPELDVGRAHAHAVGIVAARVGADEMLLQARDLFVSGAEGRENVGDGLA